MFKLVQRLTIFIIVPLFFACDGKEDEAGMNDAASIVGTWEFGELFFEVTIDGDEAATYFVNEFGLTEEEAEVYAQLITSSSEADGLETITFDANGEYTTTSPDGTENGTWELNADATVLTLDLGTVDEMSMGVNTLNSDELTVTLAETENQDINEDGTTEEIAIEATIYLTKQ